MKRAVKWLEQSGAQAQQYAARNRLPQPVPSGHLRIWNASLGYRDEQQAAPLPTDSKRAARLIVNALFDELHLRQSVQERIQSDANPD